MSNKVLPVAFLDSMRSRLNGESLDQFIQSLDEPVPITIRLNPNKSTEDSLNPQVPWCNLGHYLPKRPIFTLDPAFHGGAYYVQEASSMVIWKVMEQLSDGNKDLKVLDLCAAPGGKSTLIASFLDDNGLLVSNEVIKNRAYTLKYNLSKEGHSNVLVTNNDPKDFSPIQEYFDIILIDAPCSGEGMFRKDLNAINEWSVENVIKCASRQKRILADILPSLKPGGSIIYSTCTYNDQENIDNIDWVTEHFGVKSIPISLDQDYGVTTISKGKSLGYQFYPHQLKGEGLFISLLKKDGEITNEELKLKTTSKDLLPLDKKTIPLMSKWVNTDDLSFLVDKVNNIHAVPLRLNLDVQMLNRHLRLIYCGITIGQSSRDITIPEHSLALSLYISDDVNRIELCESDALLYLKRELQMIASDQKSWLLATYNGLGLGWLKNLGDRINNYLPKENRILMDISKNTIDDI